MGYFFRIIKGIWDSGNPFQGLYNENTCQAILTLSSNGSILSNTDLSDLSTVGTFTKCVTESCDSPDWLIQYCLSSASSRVTETVSMKMPCGECFNAYNMISLWLTTGIPIIVTIWLPKMTRYLH